MFILFCGSRHNIFLMLNLYYFNIKIMYKFFTRVIMLLWTTRHNPPEVARFNNGHFFRNRRVSIILVSFFFMTLGASPIYFGLFNYFKHVGFVINDSLFTTTSNFLIAELLVVFVSCLALLTKFKKNIKNISVFLTSFSLLQLLFLVPWFGENPYFGFAVVSICEPNSQYT